MKRLIISLFIASITLPLLAVTKEEMEQARTIAAQCYLRWSNNGSGYLDEHNPKTMAELEKVLKEKEKENLKSFKAVSTPTDYASWNKDKLVEYWGKTFFTSQGLNEEGRKARYKVTGKVKAMTVTPPKAEVKPEEKSEPAEKPAEEKPVEEKPTDQASQQPANASAQVNDGLAKAEDQIAAEEEVKAKSAEKKSSGTWVYVLILCILVGIVVWLVVFASKTMKQQEEQRRKETRRRRLEEEGVESTPYEPAPVRQAEAPVHAAGESSAANDAETARLHEQIAALTSRLEQSEAASERLILERDEAKRKLVTLQIEMENLTARLERAEQDRDRAVAASKTLRETPAPAPQQGEAHTPAPAPIPKYVPREAPLKPEVALFMGRVNNAGIFVRAERQINLEQSVYRLVTSDGKRATFTVCEDPEVAVRAFEEPMTWLANGSSAPDLSDVRGRRSIVTVTPGEAVLEEGKWRVIRKAVIRYA